MATLGNTTFSGTSSRALDIGSWRGVLVTFPEAAATGFSVWGYVADSGTGDSFKAILLDDADGTTVLASSAVRTDVSTAGWYEFSGGTFDSYEPANGESVYALVGSNSAAGALCYYEVDQAIDGYLANSSEFTGPTISSAAAIDGGARDYFVYIEYTAAGGGSIVPHAMANYRMRAA